MRVLQTKLTPNLASLVDMIRDELDFAMSMEIPETNSKELICRLASRPCIRMLISVAIAFQPVDIQDILLRIVARISARVFVGLRLCRNEMWLTTSVDYTVSIFITLITLRIVPAFLRPILVWVLPSPYKIYHHLRLAQNLLVPLIEERRKAEAQDDVNYEKPFDLLQWMMDSATPDEAPAPKIAHRLLLMSFAAIHTTTMAAVSALYDLCAHPEYFAPLREEVEQALDEDGGWKKSTVTKLRKLDSFLKESQRFNPPSLRKSSQYQTQTLFAYIFRCCSVLQPHGHGYSDPLGRGPDPQRNALRCCLCANSDG